MKKFSTSLIAAAMLLPAAALAAGVKPANGKFKQTLHYKVAGVHTTGALTITVAKGQISGLDLIASALPYSSKLSKGYACSSVSEITTKGYKRSGKVAPNGKFSITFKNKGASDTVSIDGRFTDAKHATGKFRDRFTAKLANSTCDTGRIAFAVAH